MSQSVVVAVSQDSVGPQFVDFVQQSRFLKAAVVNESCGVSKGAWVVHDLPLPQKRERCSVKGPRVVE